MTTSTLSPPAGPPTAPADVPAAHPRRRISIGRVLAWVIMALLILVTLFPFYWMLRTALSTNAGLVTDPTSLLPTDPTLDGFRRALGMTTREEALAAGGSGATMDFWRYLGNSVIVATMVTVCQVFFSAMAAYAFSRMRWPGRQVVFGAFLIGLMIPAIFTLLPNFVLLRDLGLLDTLPGIAAPTMLMTPFAVFFLRQFFMGIPTEVEEAAMIDGAGRLRTFFQIILPMAAPAVTTLAVLTYISSWNDYLWPLLVSQTDRSRVLTLALGIFRSQTPASAPDWPGLMAATLLAALPMLILFLVFARKIVNSVGFTGIK
jgi:multiple sugar transport system permease protein